jgi:hypothetical protein
LGYAKKVWYSAVSRPLLPLASSEQAPLMSQSCRLLQMPTQHALSAKLTKAGKKTVNQT